MTIEELDEIENVTNGLARACMESTIAIGAVVHILIAKGIITNEEYEIATELMREEFAKQMAVKP